MDLHTFLKHPDIQLPVRWNSYADFEEFVAQRLDTFLHLIDRLEAGAVAGEVQRRRENIVTCCNSIKQALRLSFEGHPHEAYRCFDVAMQSVLSEIEALAFNVNGYRGLRTLYRVRQAHSADLHRNDLFHIPFELRHMVATQRYSMPGLPCLYLAGSLYTCWEEMGRPPLHELQCAAFWVKDDKSLKMLNFSNRPARQAITSRPGGTPVAPEFESAQIVLWPLVFASSIIVKHRSSPFKPEYVIPQMILQWVTHGHGFDGLVYFSTHVRAISRTDPLPVCNVVLPAKHVTPFGRCARLCDVFKMTDPVSWQMLSSVNVGEGNFGPLPNFELEFIEGNKEPYHKTQFGMVEFKLNKLVFEVLRKNQEGGDHTAGEVSVL